MHWGLILTLAPMFAGPARAESPLRNDELIATLIASLDDTDVEVRQNIATALANLGDAAVPSLIAALGHLKKERRVGAAFALGRIRPPAQAAVSALLKAMKDKEEPVRREVSYALSRIVGKEAPSPASEKTVFPPLDPTPGSPKSGETK